MREDVSSMRAFGISMLKRGTREISACSMARFMVTVELDALVVLIVYVVVS